MFKTLRLNKLYTALIALVIIFGVQTSMTLAFAPPAAAEGVDIGGGTGGSGGHGGSGGAWAVCAPGGTGRYQGVNDFYLAPFPGCYGHTFVSAIASCPVGFDVWRFYGTESNPTMYTTASRVNLPNWCQTNRTYRYFLPNPQDAGVGTGDPWRQSEFTNPYNERVAIANSGGYCGDPRYSLSCFATSDYPTRYLINGQDNGSQTCANLQTDLTPISKYFSGSYMDKNSPDYEAGSAVRRGFLGLFAKWALAAGPAVALSAINSAGPPPNGGGNGDDIRFNDNIPCSSALDFAKPKGSPDPVIMGECVMPINRMARVYSGGTYAFYNLAYNSRLGANRYTTEYAGAAATQRGGAYESWRNMVRHEVNTRWEGGLPGGMQVGANVPAQPYAFAGGTVAPSSLPAGNRNEAANAAADNAFCFRGNAATYGDQTVSQNGVVADSVVIKLTAPETFQVGGALKPGKVTTSSATLMCGAVACNNRLNPLHPTLASLTYTLDLNGVNFTKCSTKYQGSCQYYIEVPAKANANGQSVTGWFYSGTNPDQKVQVTLKNLSATQQVYKQTRQDLSTCLPTSSVGGLGNIDNTCQPITITQNVKDGPPRGVPVKVGVNGKAATQVPASGVVLELGSIGAVGGG